MAIVLLNFENGIEKNPTNKNVSTIVLRLWQFLTRTKHMNIFITRRCSLTVNNDVLNVNTTKVIIEK